MQSGQRSAVKSFFLRIILKITHAAFWSIFLVSIVNSFDMPGARQNAMMNTGISFIDDEAAGMYNPAALGIPNGRWHGGALYYSFQNTSRGTESRYYSAVSQFPSFRDLGVSFHYYRQYLGEIADYRRDDPEYEHRTDEKCRSYHHSTALSGGYSVTFPEYCTISGGLTIKYDVIENGCLQAGSVLFDLAGLVRFFHKYTIGATLKNRGRNFDFKYELWEGHPYIAESPLLFSMGVSCADVFFIDDVEFFRPLCELSLAEIRVDEEHFNPGDLFSTARIGIECRLFSTLSARLGRRLPVGASDFSFGGGISLFNHVDFDFFWKPYSEQRILRSPGGISLSVFRLLDWSEKDFRWWERD